MYAFVHIEKTGGSTLNTIFRRSFGTRHCDVRLPLAKRREDRRDHRVVIDAEDLRRVRRIYRQLKGIAGHHVKAYVELSRQCSEVHFLTFLRDPAARFRSHFLNRSMSHSRAAFDEWTSADWVHNWQTKMIAGEPNAQKAIELLSTRFGFVGLTERFDESLMLLGHWLAEPDFCPVYRRVNQLSDKRRSRDLARARTDLSYLDSASVRSRIQEINCEDQKVYDFVTSTVYPQQVAGYGGDLELAVRRFQQQNFHVGRLAESVTSRFMRNYVYKPLLHCRLL